MAKRITECVLFLILTITVSAATASTLKYVIKEVSSGGSGGCTCIAYNCGCCEHLEIPKIRLNHTGCVNLTYLPDEYGIAVSVSLDGKIIYQYKVSAKNPPPVCFGVPHLKEYASLCIDFYNLTLRSEIFYGCIKIQAKLEHIIVKEIKIGCFSIPVKSQGHKKYPKLARRQNVKNVASMDIGNLKEIMEQLANF